MDENMFHKMSDDNYIMFHHPGHFLIYDKKTKYCVYDATYAYFSGQRDKTTESDPIVAVVYEMKISLNDKHYYNKAGDDFGIVMDFVLYKG